MTKSLQKKKETIKKSITSMMSGNSGEMRDLTGVAIMMLVLVAIFMIIPMIGDRLETTTALGPNSMWNSTHNTDITDGRSLWEDNGSLIALAASIVILGLIIGYVMDLGGIRTGGGPGQ